MPADDYEQGVEAYRRGDTTRAAAHFRAALAADPEVADTWFALGKCLEALGPEVEALAAYGRALACDARHVGAWTNRGRLEAALGDVGAALRSYAAALQLEPSNPIVLNNAGELLLRHGRVSDARRYLEAAIAIDPEQANAHHNLGKVCLAELRHADARSCFARAAALAPTTGLFADSLLLTRLCAADESSASLLAAHRTWGSQVAERNRAWPPLPPARPRAGRRLRLGYVSGDFRLHPVTQFLLPVLEHHERSRLEVYAYCNNREHDDCTARVRERVEHWRDIAGVATAAARQQIITDGIDILVDLSGHTSGNRLDVFATRAAPLQLSWLGYLGPTGLPTIDYRISDGHMDPPSIDEPGGEAVLRLPDCLWCHASLAKVAVPETLPLTQRCHPSFGSFNNPLKLSVDAIDLWAELLQQAPQAQMLFAAIDSEATAAALRRAFGSRGVDSTRLHFLPKMPLADYLATIAEVDVALDSFPYAGGTTTLDCLWMGVPVVSLAGERSAGRGGVSILKTLGLAELVATTPAQYQAIVLELIAAPGSLQRLRQSLRGRLAASPIADARRYTRGLEALYESAWQQKSPA